MSKTKIQPKAADHALPGPTIESERRTSTKDNALMRLAHAGAAGRAQAMIQLQQTVGNTRISTMRNEPVQRKRMSGTLDDEFKQPAKSFLNVPSHVQRQVDAGNRANNNRDESPEADIDKLSGKAEVSWSCSASGFTDQTKTGENYTLMNFGIGQSLLKREHDDFLRETVYFGALTRDPMAKVRIIGHTDSLGSSQVNEQLAKQRARVVKSNLTKIGVRDNRIEMVTGQGERKPIADNASASGRAHNRRVEIQIIPWKLVKPLPELLNTLQKDMKPYIVKVENFGAVPFQATVRQMVEEAFKPVPVIQFDWGGKTTGAEGFINFNDSDTWKQVLGLSGDIYLNSFKNNQICRVAGDPATCEKTFPNTADVMGQAIANTVVHEAGHGLGLDHVPDTDNFMWTPELHSLHGKQNKTFEEKILLQRTLQSVKAHFTPAQLVYMVNRIKERRKSSKTQPGLIEFE